MERLFAGLGIGLEVVGFGRFWVERGESESLSGLCFVGFIGVEYGWSLV